jgi:hypothetical protein
MEHELPEETSPEQPALDRIREIFNRSRGHESLSGMFALDDIEVLMRLANVKP